MDKKRIVKLDKTRAHTFLSSVQHVGNPSMYVPVCLSNETKESLAPQPRLSVATASPGYYCPKVDGAQCETIATFCFFMQAAWCCLPLLTCPFPVLLEKRSPHHEEDRVERGVRVIVRRVTRQRLSQEQQSDAKQEREHHESTTREREAARNQRAVTRIVLAHITLSEPTHVSSLAAYTQTPRTPVAKLPHTIGVHAFCQRAPFRRPKHD